jgi:quercetin dioxygenase-like cupin family protein
MKKRLFYSLLPALFVFSSPYLQAQDPVEVSPDVYSVKLENESVRILEVNLKAGQSDKMHSHPPASVHILKGGKLIVTSPDGETTEANPIDNQFLWHEGRTHQLKNIGDTDLHAIIVENKTMGDSPHVYKFYMERTKPESSQSNSYKLVDEFKKIYDENGVKVVGLWVNEDDPHEQFFMTGYKDDDHYKKFVEKMKSDPKYQEMSEKVNQDRESIEVVTLKPASEQ